MEKSTNTHLPAHTSLPQASPPHAFFLTRRHFDVRFLLANVDSGLAPIGPDFRFPAIFSLESARG